MSNSDDVDWLHRLAREDEQSLSDAAAVVSACVSVGAWEWLSLTTRSRAALYLAKRSARARELAEAGRDVEAAVSLADLDEGVSAARLAARAAGAVVAEALRERRRG